MKKLIFIILSTILYSDQTYYEHNKKITLTPINALEKRSASFSKNKNISYYKKSNKMIVGVDKTILAKCLDDVKCQSIFKKYNNISSKTISHNTYVLEVLDDSSVFDVSRTLYEEGKFLYVHPNFYKKRKLR